MRRPESVLIVVLDWQGQFLLLQKKDKRLFWQSVTGALEEGETFEAAALRELEEETGLTLKQGFLWNTHRKIPYKFYDWNRSRYAPDIEGGIEQVFYFFMPSRGEKGVYPKPLDFRVGVKHRASRVYGQAHEDCDDCVDNTPDNSRVKGIRLSDEHHQYFWAPLKEALPYFLSLTNRKEAVRAAQFLRQLRRGALCNKY